MCFRIPASPKVKSGPLYFPSIAVPSKVLPCSCRYTYPLAKSPCKTMTFPDFTKLSVDAGLIPLSSANSNVCPFRTHITPLVTFDAVPVLVKNLDLLRLLQPSL